MNILFGIILNDQYWRYENDDKKWTKQRKPNDGDVIEATSFLSLFFFFFYLNIFNRNEYEQVFILLYEVFWLLWIYL